MSHFNFAACIEHVFGVQMMVASHLGMHVRNKYQKNTAHCSMEACGLMTVLSSSWLIIWFLPFLSIKDSSVTSAVKQFNLGLSSIPQMFHFPWGKTVDGI